MESWDDDNFEPEVKGPAPAALANKWEGEDEEDDIKESWEDEDEEKNEQSAEKAVQKAKKKPLAERLAEKQRLRMEELEKRKAAGENEEDEISAEEKLRMQKESDLKLALETTFGEAELVDIPTTSEEFTEFANNFAKKVQPLTKSAEFPNFAEQIVRNLCSTLNSLDIKKIKTTVENLFMEKQKVEKGDKAKKKSGKGKVKLKVEDSNQYSAYAVDDYDDFDDFM